MKSTQFSFLFCMLFSGLSISVSRPLMSLFLIEEVVVSPLAMGLFLSVLTMSGVLTSQVIGQVSDQLMSRKPFIYVCHGCFIIGMLIMAWSREYWLIFTTSVVFLGIAMSGKPQMYAFGREFADRSFQKETTHFISGMRAAFALAWILGPPLGFWIAEEFGFTSAFLVSVSMVGIILVILRVGISDVRKADFVVEKRDTFNWYKEKNILLFVSGTILLNIANQTYLITLPLYLTKDLHWQTNFAGYLMGTAAFFEIPIMIFSSFLAARFGKKNLMLLAMGCGALFYGGIFLSTEFEHFFILQLLNGIFIGASAGIGIVLIQDLMPKHIGLATTLASNSNYLGALISAGMVGVIGQYFKYQMAFLLSSVACVIAFFTFASIQMELIHVKNKK